MTRYHFYRHSSWIGLLVISFFVTNISFAKNPTEAKFGEPITNTMPPQPFDEIMEKASSNIKKDLVVEAKVEKVCLKKGCWMEVRGEEQSARVTFKDYGFFVPQEILNKKVRLQGQLKEKVLSVKDQRHFLEDEGRPKSEIAAITREKKVFEFVVSGVEVLP